MNPTQPNPLSNPNQPEDKIPYCPIHNGPMVLRQGQYGQFWSCSGRDEFGNYCRYKPERDPQSPFYRPPKPRPVYPPYPKTQVQTYTQGSPQRPQTGPLSNDNSSQVLVGILGELRSIKTILERYEEKKVNKDLGIEDNDLGIPIID